MAGKAPRAAPLFPRPPEGGREEALIFLTQAPWRSPEQARDFLSAHRALALSPSSPASALELPLNRALTQVEELFSAHLLMKGDAAMPDPETLERLWNRKTSAWPRAAANQERSHQLLCAYFGAAQFCQSQGVSLRGHLGERLAQIPQRPAGSYSARMSMEMAASAMGMESRCLDLWLDPHIHWSRPNSPSAFGFCLAQSEGLSLGSTLTLAATLIERLGAGAFALPGQPGPTEPLNALCSLAFLEFREEHQEPLSRCARACVDLCPRAPEALVGLFESLANQPAFAARPAQWAGVAVATALGAPEIIQAVGPSNFGLARAMNQGLIAAREIISPTLFPNERLAFERAFERLCELGMDASETLGCAASDRVLALAQRASLRELGQAPASRPAPKRPGL